MFFRKSVLIIATIVLASSAWHVPLYAEGNEGRKSNSAATSPATPPSEGKPEFPSLSGPGEKIWIGKDFYFIYGFDKRPKMGTAILKVNVYTKDGVKDASLQITADSGMPSMRGAHDTGDLPMQLSRNKDYLLPINIVMPGEWEIRLTIKKSGNVILRGSHRFDV